MPTTTTPERVEGTSVVMLQAPTLQWALKRALLGIIILFVTIATAASLLYASIDPAQEPGNTNYSVPAAADPAFIAPQNSARSARRV
jgi:hypothetical protein